MEIYQIPIENLIPYENNPRVNHEAVKYVAESIRQFGFKVPIVIDKDNVIVTGHTRWRASCELGLESVPCIRADDLTEEQIRAFRLADNKVAEKATWDISRLEVELKKIKTIDMKKLDFKSHLELNRPDTEDESYHGGWYGEERERTFNAYNLQLLKSVNTTDGYYQMPIIYDDGYIPSEMIGFNYAKTWKNKSVGVHFYIDDYQFERIWNDPDKYLDILMEYDCILSPDFSLYMDMPMAMKIWNVYRSRLIGAYYQSKGIFVIPTVQWAEKETFDFCFDGIPKNSVVSVSTIGVKQDPEALNVWRAGMDELIKRIKPTDILVYGGEVDYDYGNAEPHYFDNQVTKNWT